MRKLLSIITLLTLVLSLGLAATAKVKKVTLTGYITDKNCSAKGADHPRACALKCKGSGVGLFADGKFYLFDEQGMAKAVQVMEASKSEKVVKATVKGELGDDMKLTVESIEETQ